MNGGSIFTIGGGFLLVIGIALGGFFLVMPGARNLLFDRLLPTLILGVVPAALGVWAIGKGRRASKLAAENEERGFADVAIALARKNGGQVAIDQVARAASLPSDEAQAKMRALCGRGVFDLDFDANGQMIYKLSTAQGAAQLAQLAQKS